MRETYKNIKQSETSMQDESYLVHSIINKRMHPCKDMRYSNPSSSQVLYLLIANTEEKLFAYQTTDKMQLQ
jgi:hypothetical protein